MMKSYNFCEWLFYCCVTFSYLLLVTKSELLSSYDPQCAASVCQNVKYNLNVNPCNKSTQCTKNDNPAVKSVTFCENGCFHFKEAMITQEGSINGCSKLCNLTDLEMGSSWSDSSERTPILACVYGCERAVKNFVVHILHKIKTIEPPQVLRDNGEEEKTNGKSVRLTFAKKTVQDIEGRLQNIMAATK